MTEEKIYDPSKLDFYDIKNNLKTYFRKTDQFKDYNYEASGLSTFLDVLSQNTHINGLIAAFGLNESYLNTAQLRSSVVSRATALGYDIRSKTSSYAIVNISSSNSDQNRENVLSIPTYTKFTSNVDDKIFNFYTIKPYTAYDDGTGYYSFIDETGSESVILHQGNIKTQTFYVGDDNTNAIYVINDKNIDTATMTVTVYDSDSSLQGYDYQDVYKAIEINDNSKLYQLIESPTGDYQLMFSDGVTLGPALKYGNKIVVTYLSTAGEDGNGATVFRSNNLLINGRYYPLTIKTISQSVGGDERESIDTIKFNAPLNFAAQNRLVTDQDYKSLIIKNFNVIDDVSAWGGQDHEPAEAGSVFISLKFKDGIPDESKEAVKQLIKDRLSNRLAVTSIDTKFIDPEEVFLEMDVNFNFNPNLTKLSAGAVEKQIYNEILSYFNSNLNSFGKTFRRSNLLTVIDSLSNSILDSRIDIKMQKRILPIINKSLSYVINYPELIAEPDDVYHRVSTSGFVYEGEICFIKNELGSNTLQIIKGDGTVVLDSIGSYSKGKIELVGFKPEVILNNELKITAVPANPSTVAPLRNFIINVDDNKTYINSTIDYQTVKTVL